MIFSIRKVAFGLFCSFLAAGVIWCGGFDFDSRGLELATSLVLIVAAGLIGPLIMEICLMESGRKP